MPMRDEFEELYEDVIKPTVQQAGLNCEYAGDILGPGIIMEDIWDRVERARLIIADLTGRNPNVFYEVGYAHSLDRQKVILLSQDVEDVPFDLRAFRCIKYRLGPRGPKELGDKLSKTISAVLAEEPRPAQVTGVGASGRDRAGQVAEDMAFRHAGVILPPVLGSVELLLIPRGEFNMGGWEHHRISVDDFYIGKYPVTNAQYKHFTEATGQESPAHWSGRVIPGGKDNHPVVHVSWHDAQAYCHWLAREIGEVFRLPTEAEWEKSAQGTQRRAYPWGDEFDQSMCNSMGSDVGDTTPVGSYSPGSDSPYGVADMAGNVWEWTNSLLKPYPYSSDDGRESPAAEGERVLRGGCFNNGPGEVKCAYRHVHNDPGKRGKDMGFRVAASQGMAASTGLDPGDPGTHAS